jgi:glycosyltransferase involved in cell wall biosynthesis
VGVVIPTYRDAARTVALVQALRRQRMPAGMALEIVVVDDGSGDGSAAVLERGVAGLATVLALPRNGGRAAARNAGAAASRCDLLFFIDGDCLPGDDGLLAAHLACWEPGTVASSGPLAGTGTGFWDRYQADASARRAAQHRKGMAYSGTSSNLVVDAAAFAGCGGFDPAYRGYGFEDRDLLLKLVARGHVAWAPRARVRHMDALSLPVVCAKMAQAGATAALFASRHPDAYRALGYARLDVRARPWLRPWVAAAAPLVDALARAGERVLWSRYLPYAAKRTWVRLASALSFATGTARAAAD